MQLTVDQLPGHLSKGIAPLYLVIGEEPLMAQESADAIRVATKANHFSERELYIVESGFDWDALYVSLQSQSLFGARRLIELRLPNGKPGEAGARFLTELAQKPLSDIVLLILSGKLDKQARAAKWVAAIERVGVVLTTYSVDIGRLPAWIERRMRSCGLVPGPGVAELLAHYTEGNLLACAQEIDKLALGANGQEIALDDIAADLSDNARFSVYALADACLMGEALTMQRILAGLRAEGAAPALVLWVLTREIRQLGQMAHAQRNGQKLAQVLDTYKVWSRRKNLVTRALNRADVTYWHHLLERAAFVDRVIKGRALGDEWHELERLVFAFGGCKAIHEFAGEIA